jgi:hypothetical protein
VRGPWASLLGAFTSFFFDHPYPSIRKLHNKKSEYILIIRNKI